MLTSFSLLIGQDVEIKKMSGNATYGFILYYDLHSAVTAKKYMDGTVISGNKIRVSILHACETSFLIPFLHSVFQQCYRQGVFLPCIIANTYCVSL